MLRIKEVCKEQGITIKTLAKRMGVTFQSLYSILNGNPTIGKLQEIADILGVQVSDLLERNNNDSCKCPHCGKNIHIRIIK